MVSIRASRRSTKRLSSSSRLLIGRSLMAYLAISPIYCYHALNGVQKCACTFLYAIGVRMRCSSLSALAHTSTRTPPMATGAVERGSVNARLYDGGARVRSGAACRHNAGLSRPGGPPGLVRRRRVAGRGRGSPHRQVPAAPLRKHVRQPPHKGGTTRYRGDYDSPRNPHTSARPPHPIASRALRLPFDTSNVRPGP